MQALTEPITLKDEALTEIYLTGCRKADEMFGAETRPFDRAILGLTEMLNHQGVNEDRWQVGNRWHNPLASASGNESAAVWASWMHGLLLDAIKQSERYEFKEAFERCNYWRTCNAEGATHALGDEDGIKQEAETLIAREIKQAYPSVRKNTKRWRELRDGVREKAVKVVKEQRLQKAKHEFEDLKRYTESELIKEIDRANRQAIHMETMVRDVEALVGVTERTEEVRRLAQEIRDRVTRHEDAYQRPLRRLYFAIDPEKARVNQQLADQGESFYKGVRVTQIAAHEQTAFEVESVGAYWDLMNALDHIDLTGGPVVVQ